MAAQESTVSGSQVDFAALRNVVVLAAFAAEARRVLTDIHFVASAIPEIGEQLSRLVEANYQWTVYEDTLPEVLDGVAKQLDSLAGEG